MYLKRIIGKLQRGRLTHGSKLRAKLIDLQKSKPATEVTGLPLGCS